MGDKQVDTAAPEIWLVVLNWNNGRDTVDCLESVLSVADPAIAGVVVCDNGSTDDSSAQISRWAARRTVAMPAYRWSGGEFQPSDEVRTLPGATALPRFVWVQTGANLGMITLDTHLMSLVNREMIEPDEALEKSQDPVVMKEKLISMGFKLREL